MRVRARLALAVLRVGTFSRPMFAVGLAIGQFAAAWTEFFGALALRIAGAPPRKAQAMTPPLWDRLLRRLLYLLGFYRCGLCGHISRDPDISNCPCWKDHL